MTGLKYLAYYNHTAISTFEVYTLCFIYCSLLYTYSITLINIIAIANFGKLDPKKSQAKLS